MKKALITLLLCLGIALLGTGVAVLGWVLRTSNAALTEDDPASKEKIPNVKVQILKPTLVEDRLELTGGVEPWEAVTLGAEVLGKIESRAVEEGDTVTAGQELIRIDTATIQSRLSEAEAQQRLAAQEYQRVQGMTRNGIASPQELDRAAANRDVAAASVKTLQIQLAKSVVKAPFDARVDKLPREQEEFVDVGAPLVRLVQVHKVKVVVGIPERDVPHFALGNPVRITLDALPGQQFDGQVFRIATTAEEATRTFATEVEVDNAAGLLKPGMIARATLVRKSYPDSIVVPIFSIVSLEDKRFAAIEENGTARVRPVEVGVFQGQTIQVTEGLQTGDRLIVVGQRDVRDGEPVRVQEVLQ